MSLYRRAAKRDGVEAGIVATLRRAGASVCPLSGEGTPDLLVGFRQRNVLMECKSPGGKLTPAQVRWHGSWQGDRVYVVHDAQEALAVLLAPGPEVDDAR